MWKSGIRQDLKRRKDRIYLISFCEIEDSFPYRNIICHPFQYNTLTNPNDWIIADYIRYMAKEHLIIILRYRAIVSSSSVRTN